MSMDLTCGAIEQLMTGHDVTSPILQIVGQRKIPGGPSDRYRLVLSDGVNFQSSAMLATHLNHLIENGELDNYAVIKLEKFLCNTIQNEKAGGQRRVVILQDIAILARGCDVGDKIGNPVAFKSGQPSVVPEQKPDLTKPDFASNRDPAPKPAPPANMNRGGNFYGNNALQKSPQTPGGTSMRVHPIDSLTPYQNRWQIRARVSQKSGIRTWSNSRGEGRLFSVNFVDESGEIRATGFNDAVDKFYELLEVGKIYYVSKGTLKTANKQYSSVNNDYEMTFNNETTIVPSDDDGSLPTVKFDFCPIQNLGNVAANTTVDVIGVVKQAGDATTITSRSTNKEFTKRDLTIVDQSKVAVSLTLWGSDAEKFDATGCPVLAVKGCKVSDYGGRSLSVLSSCTMMTNPDIREAHLLRGWYDNEGQNEEFEKFQGDARSGGAGGTNWMLLRDVKGGNIGLGEKPDYFNIKGLLAGFRKDNCLYKACPNKDCNKKVVDQGNAMFRCEKCNEEFGAFKWRMILSANVQDCTDDHWVTFFQETAEAVLGISAEQLGAFKTEDDTAFENVFQQAVWSQWTMKVRSKVEKYNDESRLKSICVNVNPVEYQTYNQHLIDEIEKMAV
ncbi:replication protein A 70 kDa DNA-binding subunit-like [Lineus longissimus]|uniref:replication protein A 70 kDa DNA-binding subunit-like n=1 Tax=Lineus longissimus TaxID=88925 RepID=UPI002B4D03BA